MSRCEGIRRSGLHPIYGHMQIHLGWSPRRAQRLTLADLSILPKSLSFVWITVTKGEPLNIDLIVCILFP